MTEEKIGPTGKFPRGKATDGDEGELLIDFKVGVGLTGDPIVIIDFGTKTQWIGLYPEMVDNMCKILQRAKKQALELKKKKGAPS